MDLNDFLQPKNAPVTQSRGYYTNLDSDFQFESIGATKIINGNFLGQIIIGASGSQGGYIRLDGLNNRILVNDGTVNRIVIGSV